MKTFLKAAAAFAVLAAASPALAKSDPAGHWEWQTRPAAGPSRSMPMTPVRVWVKDRASAMADCDCPMMKASAADCMMGMPGSHAPRSNG